MQTLFDMPSLKTPIHYFGGKTKARKVLSAYIPYSVREIVSPFLGGGSFELYLTGRGIRVYGYDAFPSLVNFWQVLLSSPVELADTIRALLLDYKDSERDRKGTADRFRRQDSGCALTNAAQWLILNNLSFRNKGSRHEQLMDVLIQPDGTPINILGHRFALIPYARITAFRNTLLTVGCLDFQEALAKHPDVFAYCDPPYPDTACHYGSDRTFHEEFNHERLARILSRRDKWVLSYNDVPQVRDLYPEHRYRWEAVKWNQMGIKHNYRGNDVVIQPKP